MPTGTTPRASDTSAFTQDTVATRSGFSVRVVSPNACSIVTGNAPASAVALLPPVAEVPPSAGPVEQADSERTATAAAAIRPRRREGAMRLLGFYGACVASLEVSA
ncbi:hypothetical protein QFZ50_002696 [Arthrobacter agilis]|nr:hypothetical protein [Arthrobacter agilis]